MYIQITQCAYFNVLFKNKYRYISFSTVSVCVTILCAHNEEIILIHARRFDGFKKIKLKKMEKRNMLVKSSAARKSRFQKISQFIEIITCA